MSQLMAAGPHDFDGTRKSVVHTPRGGRSTAGGVPTTNGSIFPEALEPIRRQGRVAYRASDRAVPEIVLDRPRIVSVIGQLVAAGVPQHVTADERIIKLILALFQYDRRKYRV